MSQPWTVRIGDLDVAEDSLTLGEAVDIARLGGGGWDALNPLSGPLALGAIVAVLRATRLGGDLDEAMQEVRDAPAHELLALLDVAERT